MENRREAIGRILEIEYKNLPYILEKITKEGKIIYYEYQQGYWVKYKYDENNFVFFINYFFIFCTLEIK